MAISLQNLTAIRIEKKHVVYGYIREQYKRDVPDGVILICILFYAVIDPTIWNLYLDKYGKEPANEWSLHKFVKANKDLPTIRFKEAREMYKEFRGRGKL